MTETTLRLIETTVSENTVHMRYADDASPDRATAWIEFQLPLGDLTHPNAPDNPLGDPELQFLAEIRLAALRYVRALVSAETQRLSDLSGRQR